MMKFPFQLRISLRQIQLIIGLISMLFLLAIVIRQGSSWVEKDKRQSGNNNLDTFHRQLIETRSGYQPKIQQDRE